MKEEIKFEVPEDWIEKINVLIERKGYNYRSVLLRDLVRNELEKENLLSDFGIEDINEKLELILDDLEIDYENREEEPNLEKVISQNPKKEVDKVNLIEDIIIELSKVSDENLAYIEDILRRATEAGIKKNKVRELIQTMKQNGDIIHLGAGKYQIP